MEAIKYLLSIMDKLWNVANKMNGHETGISGDGYM